MAPFIEKLRGNFVHILLKFYINFVSAVYWARSIYSLWTWVQDFAQRPEKAILSGFVATLETVLTFVTQFLVYVLLDLKNQIFTFGYAYFDKKLKPTECVFAVMIGVMLVVVLFSVIFSFATMWPVV